MKLKKLIQSIDGLEVKGSKEIEVSGISANSSLVAPGNLFIAKKGRDHDGTLFIPEAVAAGASCILTDMVDPFLPIPQLIHPNIPSIEAKLAAHFFSMPSKELKMVGITGTNGKTTTSFLVRHLFEQALIPTGLIGTIEWVVGNHRFSGQLTTPDVITNHKLLREMVTQGCEAAVMEVSSHGLDQNRIGEIDFDIALFTNISPEHLDYHGTIDAYIRAKQKLFTSLEENKWAILNSDSSFSVATKAQTFTYGIDSSADLVAKELKLSEKGVEFVGVYKREKVLFRSPLIGKFNVYNLLGAVAVGITQNMPLETIAHHMKSFKKVPGRLERVKNKLGLHIFVDFAHTEDALANVLETLRSLKKGKLITVFGCGGDRDREKRKEMGKIVATYSDIAIVTSDNPRKEDPMAIIKEVCQEIPGSFFLRQEPDRRKAIEMAVTLASHGDIILIAGKGHEKQQIFAQQILPFDDVKIAEEIACI